MSRVICIGELLIDMVNTDHKGLKEGVLFEKKAGGAPANVACAIAKMNQTACFMGQIGEDHFASFLMDTLKKYQIDTSFSLIGGKTTLALVGVDDKGERSFDFLRGCDGDFDIHQIDLSLLEKEDLLHFGSATGLLEGKLKESYFYLKDYALKHHMFISFDPNYRDTLIDEKHLDAFIKDCLSFIEAADFVKMSEEEACMIARCENVEMVVHQLQSAKTKAMAITLGERGTLLTVGNQQCIVPSIKISQVDATGAGDAFVGCMLASIAESQIRDFSFEQWKNMCSIANVTGALTCTAYGAMNAIPNKQEVMKVISERGNI